MQNSFSIEFEAEEGEIPTILEKLRAYFLQVGYIVQRETNLQVDLYRPSPLKGKKEDAPLVWINRIWLQAEGKTIRVVFSLKKMKMVRAITFGASLLEIPLGIILYFILKVPPIIPLVLIISGIVSPFMIYFVFEYIYRSSIEYFGNAVQKVIG